MTTREHCELTFSTSLDGTRTIRIADPIPSLGAAIIVDAAAGFIDANPFDETVGALVGLKRADLVRVERITLF